MAQQQLRPKLPPLHALFYCFILPGLVTSTKMPPSRFGASKFRNATPVVPGREEWYRSHLPQASSNTTSSSTSTFSSEIKSSRKWIVTVSPSGEVSWRGYESTSGGERVGSMKVEAVGDWDLSRLEDEKLIIGGMEGTVSLPLLSVLSLRHLCQDGVLTSM